MIVAQFQRRLADYPYVANWYVNASTGSDSNDGLTSGTPFKTTERLGDVLCPGGSTLVIQQNTVLHLAAGTYNSLTLSLSWPVGSSFTFDIQSDFTSSSAITLATVVDTVQSASAPVRGRITTASGTFVDKGRIRSTSGANIGAITYSTGLTSATDTWVKTWNKDLGAGNSVSTVNIASGTTCVVDTLTVTLNRLQVRMPGHPLGGFFRILDTILPNGVDFPNTVGGSASILVAQCQLGGGTVTRLSGNAQYRNCRLTAGSQVAFLGIPTAIVWGCVIEGVLFDSSTAVALTGGCCFNGGSVLCGGQTTEIFSSLQLGPTEWLNGAGLTAIACSPQAGVYITGAQYGFGTLYDVGYNLQADVRVVTTSASLLGLPATQQIVMAGNNVSYSQVPIAYPRASVTFALLADTSAVSTANIAAVAAPWTEFVLSDVQTTTTNAANQTVGIFHTLPGLDTTESGGQGVVTLNLQFDEDSADVETQVVGFTFHIVGGFMIIRNYTFLYGTTTGGAASIVDDGATGFLIKASPLFGTHRWFSTVRIVAKNLQP